jgi:hypothetical protein
LPARHENHIAVKPRSDKADVTLRPRFSGRRALAFTHGAVLPRAKQCHTKDEWEARQTRMQNSVRDSQMRALTLNRQP